MSSAPGILHVSTSSSWRGGEQQLAYLYEELAKKNVYQFLLCRKGSQLQSYCEENDIPHDAISRSFSLDPSFAKALAREAKDPMIDLVHVHDSHAHGFAVMAAGLFGMAKPIVLHRKVDYAIGRLWFVRYKYNHPSIAAIICVSKEVERVLKSSLRSSEKCLVIPSGINLNRFRSKSGNLLRNEFGIGKDTILVGNIAAITQEKDYFTFVETATLLHAQGLDLHFMVIGDGVQMQQIKDMVASKKLKEIFTFTGFRNDVDQIFPDLDILLFSSEKEGLGTTILDAFAAGVPVVATDAGGIPEIVKHEETGFLGKIRKPETLAAGVGRLINEPQIRNEIIERAHRYVRQFSKEVTAARTLELYSKLIS